MTEGEKGEGEIILRRDFKEQLLCEPCWNGAHYGYRINRYGERTNEKFSRCLQGGCECFCRALLAEQQAKRKEREERNVA